MPVSAGRRAAAVGCGVAIVIALGSIPACLYGQGRSGSITGRVTDSTGTPLQASVSFIGYAHYSVYAHADGAYAIPDVAPGAYRLDAHFPGFKSDTFEVTVAAGQTVSHSVVLHNTASTLQTVVVKSPRLNETQAAALQEQQTADNIISVMSGDEIRSLPNANAAEALARMPGVTAERDEGEGKYVEIRGTPPELQHVTIDGAYVPGTLATDVRAVKLDDVPSDLLGAIEVSKTLTADQDAAAIGGSVNLVTKIPEGPPRGYVAGQYAYQSLLGHDNGQGSLTYGGRLGAEQKFGFLFSSSYDRTNRVIGDVEPSYTADYFSNGVYTPIPNGSAFNHVYPSSWSERPYSYYRTRYGLGGDLDYRFSQTSSVFLKGLWSAFFDEANRWETNLSATGSDTLINGTPTMSSGQVKYTVSNRGPIEHTWGFTGGGTHEVGIGHLTYALNYAGSTATTHDHYDDGYDGPSGFAYTYDNNPLKPRYFVDAATGAALQSSTAYSLTQIATDNESANGQVVGGRADLRIPFLIGDHPAAFQFGAKLDNEHKGYLSVQPAFAYVGANALTVGQLASSFTFPGFYDHICAGCYTLAPFGSIPAAQQYLHANAALFQLQSSTLSDQLATYAGTEQVVAAYGMQTLDVGSVHINVGLRAEHTDVGYVGHVATDPSDTSATAVQHGAHSYTDLFPSVQVRYAIDQNTNLRAAVTRGIARPNYPDLAPSFNAVGASPQSISSPLSAGNPSLRPEHAWNYDLLAEHYFPLVGVLSGGAFYKQITDFIFDRTVPYAGPVARYNAALNGDTLYYVSQPQNGPSAHLWGVEMDYTQHLTFLPGALRGIGFDINWTHVESRAVVPIAAFDSVSYTDQNGNTVFPYANTPTRHAPIPRQFPNMFNVALLYDNTTVSARVAGQYTSASVYAYGTDGTSNPQSGDVWNYPHWQVDGSLVWTVIGRSAIQVQALNVNDAVFGFFTGLSGPKQRYNAQREYYGSTWFIGVRQGI
jgi:TonB-dependent receptor